MPVTSRTRVMAELLGSLGWRTPFLYQLDLPTDVADVYELPIASGASQQPLTFPPGITTITTLWLTTDRDIQVILGPPALNQPIVVKAGGVIGFMGGSLAAATAVSISYAATDTLDATLFVYVAGV